MGNNEIFADKVYACWLGKNIGGTLGGPLEGRMEILDVHDYTQSFVKAVENDDLDLQLVNLHAVEQYGGVVTTQLLSQEWLSHVHFQFDEYGHALTNLRKGLTAPLSGCHNNFFADCMGSPIRSELWGVLCAGVPDIAAYYAFQDACVDHAGGEGMYGEIFFAVFESLAFCNDDILYLIRQGLKYLPPDCATASAVQLLLSNWEQGLSWQENRQALIHAFGGENFTYAPINIAFTLMGLIYGTGFTERLLVTANCGWDTDCTCATVASMMGILYGSAYIDSQWTKPLGENILVSAPVNGFPAPATISALTERSLQAHRLITAHYEAAQNPARFSIDYEVQKELHYIPAGSHNAFDYRCETFYGDHSPTLAPGEEKQLRLKITSGLTTESTLVIEASGSREGSKTLRLEPGKNQELIFTVVHTGPKQPVIRGCFRLTRMENNTPWAAYEIPYTLLATNDWLVNEGQGETVLCCRDSRLPLKKGPIVTASTWLYVQRDKELRLCAVCRVPLSMKVDGVTVVHCQEETPEIPAYHRADARKCADLFLSAGFHRLELTLEQGRPLYFYVVDRQYYCAAEPDVLLEMKSEPAPVQSS